MTRRLSADREAAWGHPLPVAESFVNPARFVVHMYEAVGWRHLGRTKGFARGTGATPIPMGNPRTCMSSPPPPTSGGRNLSPLAEWVCPLCERLERLPTACLAGPLSGTLSTEKELQAVPDFRHVRGRKHTIDSVLTIHLLARLAGLHGGRTSADHAQSLSQDERQAVVAWRNPQTQRYAPPSKSVLYRVLAQADPAALEAVLQRPAMPRLQIGAAVVADGKRIRERPG